MRVVDIIRAKRDGARLDREAIDRFVAGVTDGSVPDYQASALLMAIVLRGMDDEETAWLTDAMVRSGERLDLAAIAGPKVDKHSTGGVGDKTSLVIAPLVAACGAIVPMMSGRGLGHTGGTLDKLEAIPGFRVMLSVGEIRAALGAVGCAMVGQTAAIAPADRRLYALRDVTATVESVALITASIMSKKIAEGIDALVLDVKTGRGAFMKTRDDAVRLARSLVAVGRAAGVRTEALVTQMDAPLGRAVGNALEVIEAIETLKGRGPADLERLSIALAARMLCLAGLAASDDEAARRLRSALASGAGLEKFAQIVERQGGDAGVVDDYDRLPRAPPRAVVRAPCAGYVSALDAERVGRAAVLLGAGRGTIEDAVDPAAGIVVCRTRGERVDEGDAIAELHARDTSRLGEAMALVEKGLVITGERMGEQPLVVDVVS